MVILEGVVDRLRHLHLCRAVLVPADHAFFEEAAGAENLAHGWLFFGPALADFLLLELIHEGRGWNSCRGSGHRTWGGKVLFQRRIDTFWHTLARFFGLNGTRFGVAFRQKACPVYSKCVQSLNDIILMRRG